MRKKIIPNPEMEIEDRINDLQDFEIKVNKNVDRAKIFRMKKQKTAKNIVEALEKFEDKIYPQATPTVRHSFFFKGN